MLKFLYAYQLHWPAWKFGFLKVAMLAFGIIVGSAFSEFWRPVHPVLWIVFGVTALITAAWGFQAMAQSARQERESR